MICQVCRAENPAESRFCNQCGAALVVVCPACSAANPPGSRFCNQCGSLVEATASRPSEPELAVPLADGPAMVPAMSPILGVEERRPVTVLFADIVGFTRISEQLDPEEVRDVTAACFGRLVEEIAQRGGTVDKFIGDAVMALFGSPTAHEDDPVRAVDAALAMQAALGEINGELERAHGLRLELRIGVNTGEVVAGVRQVGGFNDTTVIGDTVNTASRLQTAAAPGAVLVGRSTARLAEGAFEFESVPPLQLKGKAAPVAAFRAIGPLERLPLADAENVALVGRQAELAVLAEQVGRLAGGQGGVLVITGDPGVGKSRLLGELRRLVQADPGLRWAEAHATSYGPNQSYRMYASTLRELFGTDGLPPDEELERTRVRLDKLGANEALPFVCHLLDLPLDPSMRSGLSGLSRSEVQRRAYRAMRRLYLALGEEKPYVLAVDDLQWADPAVVDFLEGALTVVDWAPILLCFVFRPDPDAPVWPLKERAARELPDAYTEIELGSLTGDESRQLLRELLGADPGAEATLGDQAEAILLGRVEGNPLFAQEVVSTLLERGALTRKDGRWSLDLSAAGRVPETLQATILARIDRLPEEARQVVQTGAVLGRSFSHLLLTHVVGEGLVLERGLREALRAGLLRERGGSSERGYTFSQRLVQEVAERTLLVRRRKELHAATVEAIETLYPNRLAAHANALARHAYQAEAWPAAMEYARVAADRSAANYANRDAYRLYVIGLRAAEHLGPNAPCSPVVQLMAGKAELLSRFGQVEQAAAAFDDALERASRPDFVGDEQFDPARLRAHLALDLAWARIATFEVDEVERALDVATDNIQDGAPELATVWTIRSWVLLHRGDLPGAARSAREALRIALEDGGFEERAQAYGALIKPGLAGEIGPSIKTYAEEAVRLAREHQHDGHLFDALIGLEVLRLICLQPYADEALKNALEAAELAGKMHARPSESAARVILGATYISAGRWDEAEAQLTAGGAGHAPLPMVEALRELTLGGLWTARGRLAEARELLEAGLGADNFTHTGVWFNVALAANHFLAGEQEMARASLTRAEAEAARLDCLVCEASVAAHGSELLARLGDPRATELAARAEAAGGGAFTVARLLARRARAELAMHDGAWDPAVDELEAALTLADEIGHPHERARTLRALAHARAGRATPGDAEAARVALEEALATFTQLGAAPEQSLARAELAALQATPLAIGR